MTRIPWTVRPDPADGPGEACHGVTENGSGNGLGCGHGTAAETLYGSVYSYSSPAKFRSRHVFPSCAMT